MGKSEKNVITQGKTRMSDNSQDRAKNPIAQGFDKFIRSSCQKQVTIKLALFREEETSTVAMPLPSCDISSGPLGSPISTTAVASTPTFYAV